MFTVLCSSFFLWCNFREAIIACFWGAKWIKMVLLTMAKVFTCHMSVHFRILQAPGCTEFLYGQAYWLKASNRPVITFKKSYHIVHMTGISRITRCLSHGTCQYISRTTAAGHMSVTTAATWYDLWWFLLLTSHSWPFSWPGASRQQQYPRKELK